MDPKNFRVWLLLKDMITEAERHRPVTQLIYLSGFSEDQFSRSAAAAAKSLQSCLTLCDPMDCSPPDSPVPGILQVRTLEWVAISFSNA